MDKFKLIKEFSRKLTSTLELEELANVINSFAVIHLGAEHSSIVIKPGCRYSYSGKSDQTLDAIEKQTFKYILKVGKLLKISNPKNEYMLKDINGIKSFHYFITSLPLITKNSILGSLNLYSSMPFDEDLFDFLSLFAELSASSMMNSLSYRNLGEKSITDKLTGLYNRTNFDAEVQMQIEKCRESDLAFSAMMLDLDNFKEYNDEKGHQAGDKVLKEVGKALRSCCGDGNMAFRYGGEELVVVVPRLNSESALQLAEKIRNEIESSGKITVSIGLVTCRNSSCSAQTMVSEADKALYRAKKEGKNRVSASIIIDKSINSIDIKAASEIGRKK